MSGIVVSDLAYAHPGGDVLFSGVSFKIAPGERAGLIGTNGVGKSTLLRIVAGALEPLDGSVAIDGRLGYMPQDIGVGERQTVREMLLALAPARLRAAGTAVLAAERALAAGDAEAAMPLGDAIGEWSELGGYQLEAQWDKAIRRVLRSTLDEVGERDATEISGGERKQIALEHLFASDSPVLLLDEPDNFLDVPAKKWLEELIAKGGKTVLLISHDRDLLSAATQKIVTLEASGAWVHGASYATYVEAREQRQRLLGDALQRWKDEERRLFHFYKTMKQRAKLSDANARRADAAETRWQKFVDAGPPPAPVSDQQIRVRLRGGDSARRVVQVSDLAFPGIVAPFEWEVHFGERIGVIGPNGSGKSHLVRLLAGEDVRHEGRWGLGPRVLPGLFTQLNVRSEFLGRGVGDIATEATGSFEAGMRALARYGLQGNAQQTYDTLSGGQKARLEILALELEGSNLLLLDEPTDNLDIDSSEALEQALDGFEGTVVAVSHDRAFLRQLDRYLMLLHDGRAFELLDLEAALQALLDPGSVDRVRTAKPLAPTPPSARGGPSSSSPSGRR